MVWFQEQRTLWIPRLDLAWKEVEKGTIPQTLYIPDGCDLTLTNMKVLSSVRIVVEKGGKLTLNDSVVQGMIDVKAGGTFSMIMTHLMRSLQQVLPSADSFGWRMMLYWKTQPFIPMQTIWQTEI